ncbi:MAG TPA: L-seryl-tRNA(Sec) selenium transferase [Egibacteraceae bacterium]|nr:L-seryl-tRNA(Sec) selenium transferase [Egibacteraceae bacterium]
MEHNPLRQLPRIDALLRLAHPLIGAHGRQQVADALRAAVEQARHAVAAGEAPPSPAALVEAAAQQLETNRARPPRPVINATGVVIHTNMGRAPLSDAARSAMADAAGYCDVELDLDTGRRGSRTAQLDAAITAATGGPAGTAVNNAAGALVLVLAALAGGADVLVSRGELVEIGGSFRLPDIMRAAGVRLVEVGTTNRTRARDFAAVGNAALILKVHPSNYRITGFTESPTVAELAEVAQARGVPLVHDVGSGLLADVEQPWLAEEPNVQRSLHDGADLVIFSGDKLLGGPQAGLLVGRAELVARCTAHPLARALRLDKQRVAGLIATLQAHADGRRDELPVWRSLTADPAVLEQRLRRLADGVGGTVVAGASLVGGGAAPQRPLPTPVLRITGPSANAVAAALRTGTPAVVVRVDDDTVVVDLRTVDPSDDDIVRDRLREVFAAHGTGDR